MLWTHHLPTLWALSLTLLTTVLSSPIALRTTGPWLALDTDFPDPGFVQADDGTWYAFGTNGNNRTVQVAKSTDFKTWTLLDKEALPTLAGWETQIDHWAPDVVRRVTTPHPLSIPPQNTNKTTHRTTANTSSTTAAKHNPISATTASAPPSPPPRTPAAPTSPTPPLSPAVWTKAGASTHQASSTKTARGTWYSKSTATASATAGTATTELRP